MEQPEASLTRHVARSLPKTVMSSPLSLGRGEGRAPQRAISEETQEQPTGPLTGISHLLAAAADCTDLVHGNSTQKHGFIEPQIMQQMFHSKYCAKYKKENCL